jgi:hypothetical protein
MLSPRKRSAPPSTGGGRASKVVERQAVTVNHLGDNALGALAILMIFGAPIGAWVFFRLLAHQERMAMIRHGVVPPPGGRGMGSMPPPVWPPPGGMAPPPAGKGAYAPYDDYFYAQTRLRKGIRLTLIGLALVIGLGGFGPFWHVGFGPQVLAGLVPMFIGIGQIVDAMLSGARFGGYAPPLNANFGPPPGAGPGRGPAAGAAATPPPAAGPYAWRPGNTPEIERPVQPPDQR